MNVIAQKFQSLYALVCKLLAWWNHRTTLPQSALAGCQLPQRGSREWASTIHRTARKAQRFGRFSSPLRNSKDFGFYHSSDDTPSVSPSGCQLPQRGSRDGFHHSPDCSLNRGVSGDFHRPYGTQKILHSTVQPGEMGKCLHNSRKKVDIITGKQEKIDFFVAICYNNTDR